MDGEELGHDLLLGGDKIAGDAAQAPEAMPIGLMGRIGRMGIV